MINNNVVQIVLKKIDVITKKVQKQQVIVIVINEQIGLLYKVIYTY